VANEVCELTIFDVAASTIGFDHEHLVGGVGVNVVVNDVRDCGIGTKRSHSTSTGAIAVNVLDKHVG